MRKFLHLWPGHGVHPLRSALGGALGIGLTVLMALLVARFEAGHGGGPLLMASLGASAVLAFAVPASPLAQPRAIIGGNVVSALAGVAALWLMPPNLDAVSRDYVGIPLALSAAIVGMHLARCLHPPGGAVALMPFMGGAAIARLGFGFVLYPVAVNSVVLVAGAFAFNNLVGSRYPHRAPAAPPTAPPIAAVPAYSRAHLEAVLDEMEDQPDIEVDELDAIIRAVIAHAGAPSP